MVWTNGCRGIYAEVGSEGKNDGVKERIDGGGCGGEGCRWLL